MTPRDIELSRMAEQCYQKSIVQPTECCFVHPRLMWSEQQIIFQSTGHDPNNESILFFFCFFPCPASSNDLSPWMNNDRLFRFIVVAAAWRRWPDKRARGYININSKQTTGRSMYHHHAIPDWTGTKLCASEIHNELSSSTSLEWIGREFSWDYAR